MSSSKLPGYKTGTTVANKDPADGNRIENHCWKREREEKMSWKFWEKETQTELHEKTVKLKGPGEIPEPVGRDLVVILGKDPDWVWNLKSVVRPRSGNEDCLDVRVFSAHDTDLKQVTVKNYTSLDEHPELILFDGWYNKKTREVHIAEKTKPQGPAKAA
jgi:hypothetical protein